jgi:hypothetical protein
MKQETYTMLHKKKHPFKTSETACSTKIPETELKKSELTTQ